MGGCCGTTACGNKQATPRSIHPGGIYVCFCDGHVYFINDNIDHNPYWGIDTAAGLHVWEKLCACSDGQPINESDY
jgi:prepilin-type processing-associated H-X9-DG protein